MGKNFGVAFSSISIIFIKKIGWRSAYASIGGLGILGGLLSMAFMKNPEKIRKSF
jgi:predicted MFS family arabinose efflux permease